MNPNETAKKSNSILERKQHERKCIGAGICPDCGEELRDFGDEDHDIEVGCNKCSGTETYKKFYFFGPILKRNRIKYWD